jgi:hypothetical protein
LHGRAQTQVGMFRGELIETFATHKRALS